MTRPAKTDYGGQASALAGRIPHCVGVSKATPPTGLVVGSVASCSLHGRSVTVATFADSASQHDADDYYSGTSKTGYFAEGPGYIAIALGKGVTSSTQKTISKDVIDAIGGNVVDFQSG